MAFKLFIDTNVFLDFLMQRGEEWQYAREIFILAERSHIHVFTSSSCVINLMYVMGTYKLSRQEIVDYTTLLLSYTKLVNPDNITFEIALGSAFKGMEDAVQYYTAFEIKGVDYFITSNIKDYKNSLPQLTVITPRAFMEKYQA